MLGPRHYVPILKCKRGEKRALQLLAPWVRAMIMPMVEVVELRPGKTLSEHLATSFRGLPDALPRGTSFYLDAGEIGVAAADAATEAFRRAEDLGLTFVPVCGPSRPATENLAAVSRVQLGGVCVRLRRTELERGALRPALVTFMAQHGLSPSSTDLVLDMGAIEAMVVPGALAVARAFIGAIPDVSTWRNLVLAGCSFPKSMGVLGANQYTDVERVEWLTWRDYSSAAPEAVPRVPTYGDCAIQHPSGVEGFDPRVMQVSAAVRYTSGDSWLLIKGRSTRISPAREQFRALASVLAPGGQLGGRFAGVDHCRGCADIAACASGAPNLGSAEAWRRIGTVHHITVVAEQLAALPAP